MGGCGGNRRKEVVVGSPPNCWPLVPPKGSSAVAPRSSRVPQSLSGRGSGNLVKIGQSFNACLERWLHIQHASEGPRGTAREQVRVRLGRRARLLLLLPVAEVSSLMESVWKLKPSPELRAYTRITVFSGVRGALALADLQDRIPRFLLARGRAGRRLLSVRGTRWRVWAQFHTHGSTDFNANLCTTFRRKAVPCP